MEDIFMIIIATLIGMFLGLCVTVKRIDDNLNRH